MPDDAEGRTKFVAHIGQEGALGAVSGLALSRACTSSFVRSSTSDSRCCWCRCNSFSVSRSLPMICPTGMALIRTPVLYEPSSQCR